MKIRQVGAELFDAEGRTDRYDSRLSQLTRTGPTVHSPASLDHGEYATCITATKIKTYAGVEVRLSTHS